MKTAVEAYLILGVTPEGRAFRPSDWAERLCGVIAGYDTQGRWVYSNSAQPVLYQGQTGVRVEKALEASHPAAYQFIMDFAYSNRLKVVTLGEATLQQESMKTIETAEVSLTVRELTLPFLLHQWRIKFSSKYSGS